jgi:hypothetical protein
VRLGGHAELNGLGRVALCQSVIREEEHRIIQDFRLSPLITICQWVTLVKRYDRTTKSHFLLRAPVTLLLIVYHKPPRLSRPHGAPIVARCGAASLPEQNQPSDAAVGHARRGRRPDCGRTPPAMLCDEFTSWRHGCARKARGPFFHAWTPPWDIPRSLMYGHLPILLARLMSVRYIRSGSEGGLLH